MQFAGVPVYRGTRTRPNVAVRGDPRAEGKSEPVWFKARFLRSLVSCNRDPFREAFFLSRFKEISMNKTHDKNDDDPLSTSKKPP
jgi:hypothetical protein